MKNIIQFTLIFMILGVLSCNNDEFFERERPTESPWLDVESYDYSVLGVYNEIGYGKNNDKLFHDNYSYKAIIGDEVGLAPWFPGNTFDA